MCVCDIASCHDAHELDRELSQNHLAQLRLVKLNKSQSGTRKLDSIYEKGPVMLKGYYEWGSAF